ncbi:hypothetical protein TIFTF001_040256 [Ficus carica]|uniref:Transposase MuDR plant domain-containing protein n=1 Tax=Ficus carica TaxID=3494 RepID=A0AA87Z1V0_FICCA|nr:hypothetical protein TIFTF001_040256 [Ficus carica]
MPPKLGESNHIDVQLPTEAVHSDEAIQHVDDRNWTFPPLPPHIPPLPPHVDESKFAGDARQSNENSIAASIGAHFITNYTTSQSVNVPNSNSLSGSLVVVDYTPVTIRINSIFENKKLLQYHLHHDAMSKHYQFKVKRSNSTLLHVICIDIEKCQWQLRATRMRGSELFVVKRYDDVHTCSIEIVQGHYRQAKSWMIGEHKGIEFASNLVYPDAAFGICVQHLAANLKTKYKDFKGPLKTYFDGAARSYLSILLAAQMAGMFLKKLGRKLSILPKQSVGPEGHGLEGFCLKEKNMSLFGVVDVMVMDTTDKPVQIQYP